MKKDDNEDPANIEADDQGREGRDEMMRVMIAFVLRVNAT